MEVNTKVATTASVDDSDEAKIGEQEGRHWALFNATAPQMSVLAAMVAKTETLDDVSEDTVEMLDRWLMVNLVGVYELENIRGYPGIFRMLGGQYAKRYLHSFVRAAEEAWQKFIGPIN